MSAYKEDFIERQTKSIITKFTQNYNMVIKYVSQTSLIITPPGEFRFPTIPLRFWVEGVCILLCNQGTSYYQAKRIRSFWVSCCVQAAHSSVLKVPKCCALESPEWSFKPLLCKAHPNSNENLWEWASSTSIYSISPGDSSGQPFLTNDLV